MDTGRLFRGFGHTGASSFEMISLLLFALQTAPMLIVLFKCAVNFVELLCVRLSKGTACAAMALTTLNIVAAKGKVSHMLD